MKHFLIISPLLLCCFLVAGCGPKRPDGLPPLFGCVLTFQFEDGSPVDGASVSLISDNSALAQWSISGTTDSSGVVNIHTHGDFVGAPSGTYKITVSKAMSVDTGRLDESGEPILLLEYLVNERYGSSSTTTLALEITNNAVKETFTVEK